MKRTPRPRASRFATAVLALAVAAPAFAQAPVVVQTPPDFPRGTISGYLFGDWYDNLAGNPAHAYDASGADAGQANIDGKTQITRDLNGAQLRRAYFQVDNDLSIKYSTRFRLEADSKSLTSDGKIGVAVKAAYMKVRNVYPRADLFFGVVATPTFENSEDYWQFRSVEKTLVDFRGLAPSADVGLELKGFADPGHIVGYTVMVGDGNGNKPESNRDKRTYVALPLHWKDFRLEPYADYENLHGDATHKDRATYKLFAGYDLRHGAVGYEYVEQVGHKTGKVAGPYSYAVGHSVFARWSATPMLAAFARMDAWQPDLNNANRVNQFLYIAGVDWQPLKDVHFMPNIESLQYNAKGRGVEPGHGDLQARVTLFWKFTKPQS
jgi:hypothetical protein